MTDKNEKKPKKPCDIILIVLAVVIITSVVVYLTINNASDNSPDDMTVSAEISPEFPTPEPTPVTEPSPAPEVPPPTPEATPEITPTPTPPPTPAPVYSLSEDNPELSEALDELATEYNCVGVSLAFYDPQSGYGVYRYGYADLEARTFMEEETKVRVASLSKVVAMMLAMTLVDENKLDLDADVSDYLGFEVINPQYPETEITSRMLIQHTSSLYDTGAFNSGDIAFNDNTIRELLGTRTVFRDREPGGEHEYSDFGYVILGAVCEAVSGKPLDTLARDTLFVPLGIDAAFVAGNLEVKNIASQYNSSHTLRRSASQQLQGSAVGPQYRFAVGNLVITALDYAKILNLLVNGGEYDGVRVLSEESVREIHTANVLGNHGYMQALSVRLVEGDFFDDNVYYHTGSAYGTLTQFFYSLDTGRIAVVLTTGSNSGRGIYNSVDVCTEMSELVWTR